MVLTWRLALRLMLYYKAYVKCKSKSSAVVCVLELITDMRWTMVKNHYTPHHPFQIGIKNMDMNKKRLIHSC